MPSCILMGEPSAAIESEENCRRRKFPSFKVLRASSFYRNFSSKPNYNDGNLGKKIQYQQQEEQQRQQRISWKERFSKKWKISRSISQGSLKIPKNIFKLSKRKPNEEEANYSTDDDGGFKVWRPPCSPKKKRNGALVVRADVEYASRFDYVVGGGVVGGKERPKSIASLPVRRRSQDEEIIVYYDDCLTKSDSSLLSSRTFSCGAAEGDKKNANAGTGVETETEAAYACSRKRNHAGTLSSSSSSSTTTVDDNRCRKRVEGCGFRSVDSLPATCRSQAELNGNRVTSAIVDKSYLSASYPGYSSHCLRTRTRAQAGAAANTDTLDQPSPVAYQPQVVSTPAVANNRQLSTNPSRRPNDFPSALVNEDVTITSASASASASANTNTNTSTGAASKRRRSPLMRDYDFWLSYDVLNDRRNAAVCDSHTRHHYRNRLSLPIFSRNSKNQKFSSPRSSSLSSVYNLITPSALPTKAASLALQQLLTCYRNGDMTQEKISLLLDILDTQERFAKVISYYSFFCVSLDSLFAFVATLYVRRIHYT